MKTQDSGTGNFWIKHYITHFAVWEGGGPSVIDISAGNNFVFPKLI